MRNLIVLMAVVVAVLSCAIFVAANSPGRSRTEALLAEAKSQVDEARKACDDADARIDERERANADLKNKLDRTKASLDEQAEKLAAAEKEALRLRTELEAAAKQAAELSRKYADAVEAERKARLDAEAAKKDAGVAVVKAPVAEVHVVHDGNNKRGGNGGGKNGGGVRRRGSVASLPRTTPSFSELDKDHDGRLSFDEYKAGYPDATQEDFKALDTNGDGKLSISEYKAGHPDPDVVFRPKKTKKN